MYLHVLTIDFIKMIDVYQPGHIRGVARGSWGARAPPPPLARPSFEQTTKKYSGGENAMTISWP